jgi:uncharacterized protein YqgC (DUF456 family)
VTGEPVVVVMALLMALGMAGTILPFLPGLALIWGTALAYGMLEGFGTSGALAMGVITVLLLAGVSAKYVMARRRVSVSGAPASTVLFGALGGLAGFFLVPVVGFAVGAIVGLLVAERARTGGWEPAWIATKQVLAAYGLGILVEIVAGMGMVVSWAAWVWTA